MEKGRCHEDDDCVRRWFHVTFLSSTIIRY
jgi:hypothetical protein